MQLRRRLRGGWLARDRLRRELFARELCTHGIERDRSRVGYVEALDASWQRQSGDDIAMGTGEVAQPFAFRADNESHRLGERSRGEVGVTGAVKADAERAVLAQHGKRAGEIPDNCDRDIFKCARGGLGEHAGRLRAVTGGRHQGLDRKCRSRSQDGSDIVRVGDLVEHQQQSRSGDVLDGGRRQRLSLGVKALVHRLGTGEGDDYVRADNFDLQRKRHGILGQPASGVLGREQAAEAPLLVRQCRLDAVPAIEHYRIALTRPALPGRGFGSVRVSLGNNSASFRAANALVEVRAPGYPSRSISIAVGHGPRPLAPWMQSSDMNYLPLAPAFFAILVGIFLLVVVVVEIRVLRYAYMRTGVSSPSAILLLLGSLFGSYINIPVYHFPGGVVREGEEIIFFGVHYVVPVLVQHAGTTVAVNVGGAVIPTLLSLYLLSKYELWILGILATALIAAIMHMLATPVPGVGIAVPIFMPPIVTAIVAVLLARTHAAALAYASGSLGTLIGADLLNLPAVEGLGAPVASIGGAGTFDGIFMTGIVAVLLASFSRRA
jgi:uncharacterized membrane protein